MDEKNWWQHFIEALFKPREMPKREKKGRACDEQTGKCFDIEPEVLRDIAAATFSCLYLIGMLIFFCWQLFDMFHGQNLILKWAFSLPNDFEYTTLSMLIAYTAIGGGLGGVVNGFRSFIVWHAERKAFGWRFMWKYITLPLLGFILAAVVYALVRGGVAVFGAKFTPEGDLSTQIMSAFGVGALVGYGSHKVFRWLDEQVNKLFKTAKVTEVQVPDLINKTREEAKDILEKSDLKVGKVEEIVSEEPDKINKVIDQDPREGSMISRGGAVNIVVAIVKKGKGS